MSPSGTLESRFLQPFLAACQIQRLGAGICLMRQGEVANDLFFIVQGSVAVELVDGTGREFVLAYLNEGEFFGEIAYFSVDRSRTAMVRTRTPCTIARIGYSRLPELTDLYPALLVAMTSQLAKRLRATNQKLSDLAFIDVSGRVARALLELSSRPEATTAAEGIKVVVTRKELARLVGCTREMVTKVLKQMVRDEQIATAGRSITLYPTAIAQGRNQAVESW